MTVEQRSVVFEEMEILYTLERKEVKNLNLRIRKDGSVWVSASPYVQTEVIDDFVVNKGRYILVARHRFERMIEYQPQPKQYVSGETFFILGHGLRLEVFQGECNEISSDGAYLRMRTKDPDDFEKKRRLIVNYLNVQCREVFLGIVDELYPVFQKYGITKPILRIRDMDTRWGSCLAKKGVITLNKKLLEAPRDCIEYVVMHEMCHFIHPNHSNRFYTFLTMLMPDWKERKVTLDRFMEYGL